MKTDPHEPLDPDTPVEAGPQPHGDAPMEEQVHGVPTDAADSSPRQPALPIPPRIWTALVLGFLALPLAGLVQAPLLLPILMDRNWSQDSEAMKANINADLKNPGILLYALIASQVGFLVIAVLPALLSKEPWKQRLGLRRPEMDAGTWLLAAIGTLLPIELGAVAITLLVKAGWLPDVGDERRGLSEGIAAATGPWLVAIVAAGSILPGIIEELLFRGYVQSRLLKRWPPAAAIGVTTLCFGIAHGDVTYAVFTLPVGVYLGYVAWRANSTIATMPCHALVNATHLSLMGFFQPTDVRSAMIVFAGLAAISLPAFLGAVARLERRRPAPHLASTIPA